MNKDCLPQRKVKVTIDGSFNHCSGIVACAAILRNHVGEMLQGVMFNIGIRFSLQAELWGILLGLKMTWDFEARSVILESDCLEAVDAVTESAQSSPDSEILAEVSNLLGRAWVVEFSTCPRNLNNAANLLARKSLHISPGVMFIFQPPEDPAAVQISPNSKVLGNRSEQQSCCSQMHTSQTRNINAPGVSELGCSTKEEGAKHKQISHAEYEREGDKQGPLWLNANLWTRNDSSNIHLSPSRYCFPSDCLIPSLAYLFSCSLSLSNPSLFYHPLSR